MGPCGAITIVPLAVGGLLLLLLLLLLLPLPLLMCCGLCPLRSAR